MSVLRIAGGVFAAAVLCALAIALWPASEADKARDDGERVGAAVTRLYEAENSTEVDAALAELDAAVSDTRAHAGDEVADQVADQQDALARAAEGFSGYYSTDSDWDQALYEAELEVALDDLYYNAEDFRDQGPEVNDAFWEGVDEGLTIEA
jgi:hypothetical protein